MKKIFYIIPVFALTLASCDNFFDEKELGNEGYTPSDVRTGMTYTFTDDDYKAVSKNADNIQKALALCTPDDSSAYTNLLAIGTQKCFTEDASADMYAAPVLRANFPYLDNGTICEVTYTLHEGKSSAVLPFQASSSYTLTTDDYEQIWQKRGVSYLTPSTLNKLQSLLAEKVPTAKDGKVMIINYDYSAQEPDTSEFSEFLPYKLRLSQLLAFPDYKEHEITGTVGKVTSALSGRFYMKDGSDSILVYGLYDENGNKVWKSLGINVGDDITIKSKYSDESEEPQLVNAVYISHSSANAPRRKATRNTVTNTTAAYQLTDGAWTEYTNDQLTKVIVLQPATYTQMGVTSISAPETLLAKYLLLNYPYAAADDQYLVVYKTSSGYSADIFTYDGSAFVMSTGYVNETMSFEVKNNAWVANISTYLTQKFVGEGLGKFSIQHVNLDGLTYVWRYQASYGATASAYVSSTNHRVEDWLISPTIRLKKAIHPQLTFDQAVRYGSTDYNTQWLNVMVTDNFTGDVTTTEWTHLDFPAELPDGSSWVFQTSGAFDLSAWNDKKIVIAFRYNTNIDGIEVSSAPTWEIQNLLVAEAADSTEVDQ